ncbi:LLM class F420-dependent oxidoreductase [Seongchinamella sediminis]|uniref:LLM class F420-dependent oxidoreductase n=1 Tax=Seongchinamella sediminis TaxID=2283635 RepID=A0A3L7DRW7_9GAMM|nr:LLM class F420-dependent oxidoreductase [Seongchinamella sediminis]RLQ20174.1 LLM class F420-dependent oxidoreductase [Seongchinamella sediminis]
MHYSVVTPLWQDRPAADNLEVAINADKLQFPELWIGEMATYDAFAFATAAGLKTRQIKLSIGPLAVSVRTPATMAIGAASVADLTGRDVQLALGASSVVVVEEWHGRVRERTATHLAETAQIIRGLLDGDKVSFEGELARCKGYHLRLDAPGSPITIAAFGPAAVRAAARHADRMLLNMCDAASVARLREQMEDAAAKAGRPAPRLAVWLSCAVEPQRETIEQLLRAKVGYLAAPGYSDMFVAAGFGDLVEYARTRPHPRDLLAAMPGELVSAIGLVGSEAEIDRKLEEYRAAGADEICLVPATTGDPGGLRTLQAMGSRLD